MRDSPERKRDSPERKKDSPERKKEERSLERKTWHKLLLIRGDQEKRTKKV